MKPEQHDALRKAFPRAAIGKMPKGGTYLDYVGHAATTDRLLSVDNEWTWEPVAFDPRGLPQLDEFGGLWIRLTVCGVTRYGYGDAAGKKGPNAVKEAIGDAIRNAAMRFGVALDLWAKEDISHTTDAPAERKAERLAAVPDDDPFYSTPAGDSRGEAASPAGPGRPFMDSPDGAPTKAQMGMLGALLKGQTREQALAVVSSIVGRDVESRSDLSKRETSQVIDALKKAEAAS